MLMVNLIMQGLDETFDAKKILKAFKKGELDLYMAPETQLACQTMQKSFLQILLKELADTERNFALLWQ